VIPMAAIDREDMAKALGLMEQDYTSWEVVLNRKISKDMGWTYMIEFAPVIDEEHDRVYCWVKREDPTPLLGFLLTYDIKTKALLYAQEGLHGDPGAMERLGQMFSIRRRYCISIDEETWAHVHVFDRGELRWKSPLVGEFTETGDYFYYRTNGGHPLAISPTGRYIAGMTNYWWIVVWEGRA